MNTEEEIFEHAAALPEAERPAYLDATCAGQPELRARIESLLLSHEVSGFMQDHTVAMPGPPVEQSGERIGRYRLLQQIGEGGFGTVWMAEQVEPVTRRVALKIIKAGMDTKEVIARFEAERQALAMMDHPNIARVFDAGTTGESVSQPSTLISQLNPGRPYFVMELVKGIPITRFCDEQQFTTRQRLELFGDVCSAINHAHQKGVIHRDIKPSNVMVTLNADRPVVKVIDFGIAKATRGKLTDRTLFTRFEQFIGTPAYMSPEQAAISDVDIDTRSDIYALGVLLYELLTGKPPFDAKTLVSAGYEEMRRIIREVEPARPSLCLSTLAGDERTALASARHIAPEKLSRLVEPDLDWIVMKAIEKDRSRRYETANGLALDIKRFLTDEPVSAGRPSASYRFRKFARRHKTVLRTVAAIAAMLIGATIVSTLMAVKAHKAEQKAQQKAADEAAARKDADYARNDAEALVLFFTGVVRSADVEQGGRDRTVMEAINTKITEFDKELSAHPERTITLHGDIIYTLHTLGFTRQVVPLQEKIRSFHVSRSGRHHPDSLSASLMLGYYILRSGNRQEWERARSLFEEITSLESALPPGEARLWLDSLSLLAECHHRLGRKNAAAATAERALAFCRNLYAHDSRQTLDAVMALSMFLAKADRLPEATALREEALAIYRKIDGMENPKTLSAMHGMANLYFDAGRREKALELRQEVLRLRRKVLSWEHPDTLIAMHNLAESYFEAGRKTEAIDLLEYVLPLRPRVSGEEHQDTLEAMHDLATWYHDAGKLEEALKLREQLLPLRTKVLSAAHPDTLEAMTNLSISYRAAGRLGEAIPLQERALAQMRHLLRAGHPWTVDAMLNLAECYAAAGRAEEAAALRKEADAMKAGVSLSSPDSR